METPNLNTAGRKLTQDERNYFGIPNPEPTNDVVVSATEGEVSPIQTPPSNEELSHFDKDRKVWRLSDGTLTTLGPGRPPKGAVLVFTPQKTPKATRAPKATVMLRLADGTIKPRGKGRPPKGSVVIENNYPNTSPETEES